MIRDCLRRIAHVEQPPEISITPSPRQWHYRARANWQFDPGNQRLGYFERGSHRVCDVAECAVLVPRLQQTLEQLRREASSLGLTRKEGRQDARQDAADIEAAAGEEDVSVVPTLAGLSAAEISRRIGDNSYQYNAASFFQVNHELLEPLVSEAINDAGGETAVDLYCGVGLFTLALARRFQRVAAVEANPTAARFARRNLNQAGISNTKVVTDRVGDWLRAKAGAIAPVDFLLLDPPRAGVEDGAIETLLNLRPRRLSYVSCDPATLARDLNALLGGGYSLDSVRAFDMFPQTHHVETVSHLSL
jgi:23S rRNA (uracil1939-C5)-methyltransferase